MAGALDLQNILGRIKALEELASSGENIEDKLPEVRQALDRWYNAVGDYKTYYMLAGRLERAGTKQV